MEKVMEYTESYYSLSHGTDQHSAENSVKEGFSIKGDATSWCGKGVYFYDIKGKAWWAAKRKCSEIKKTKKQEAIDKRKSRKEARQAKKRQRKEEK